MEIKTSYPPVIPILHSHTISQGIENNHQTEQQKNDSAPKRLMGFQNPEQRVNINRKGPPRKEWTMKQLYIEAMEKVLQVKNKKGEVVFNDVAKKIIAQVLVKKAVHGDIAAIRELTDRIDGQAEQKQTVTVNPIPIADIPDKVIEGEIV